MNPAQTDQAASSPEANWKSADLASRRGRGAEALNLYRSASELVPDEARLHLRIGRRLHADGDLARAREVFGRALEVREDCHPARLFLALVDLDEGAIDDAATRLDEVIATQPENLTAICLRELARYLSGDRARALRVWDRKFSASSDFLSRLVLAIESDRPGNERESGGLGEGASADLSGVKSAGKLGRMCRRAWKRKDYASAIAALRELSRRRGKDPDVWFALGHSAQEAGACKEAADALGRCLIHERRSQAKQALNGFVVSLRRALAGFPKRSRQQLCEALRETPFNSQVLAMRGLVLTRLGRSDEARESLGRVKVEGPESYNKFYYLGLCAIGDGERDAALRYFRYAFERFGADTIEFCLPEPLAWARRQYAEQGSNE